MSFLQGQLLIAAPQLRDPNFHQTVVLLIQHTESGALGLVLNRPTTTAVKSLWAQVSKSPCRSQQRLQAGGPVQGPLLALHSRESCSEDEVLDGLHVTSNREHIEELLAGPEEPLRLYAGYAGWGSGQLEAEMEEGSWFTADAALEHVFQTERNLWDRLIKRVHGRRFISSLKIKHVPADPRLN